MPTVTEKINPKTLSATPSKLRNLHMLFIAWVIDMFGYAWRSKSTVKDNLLNQCFLKSLSWKVISVQNNCWKLRIWELVFLDCGGEIGGGIWSVRKPWLCSTRPPSIVSQLSVVVEIFDFEFSTFPKVRKSNLTKTFRCKKKKLAQEVFAHCMLW